MSTFTFLHEINDIVYAIRDCNSGVADAIQRGEVISATATQVDQPNTTTPLFTMSYVVRFNGNTFTSNIIVPFTVVTGQQLLAQDQTYYDGVGLNGVFTPGGGYVPGEVITLNDGSLVTLVGSPAIGDFGSPELVAGVASFLITPSAQSVSLGVELTQVSSTGTGFSFALTPQSNNATQVGYAIAETETGSNLYADKADAVAAYAGNLP